ncbi:hypothetical protein R6Q57_010577 [Mikania cordata]
MASKDSKISNVVVVSSDDSPIIKQEHAEKDASIKTVVVDSDDNPIIKQEHAEKDAGIKNVVVDSDDNPIIKQEHAEKDAGIKNVVVGSDNSISEKDDKKEGSMKNVVASDRVSDEEEDDDDKETGTDLGLSMDKLNLGPKKKLLVLPIGGFLVHRAHRRRPNTIPRNRKPDFCSGNFMIYNRPFCEGFLKFCFERFEVGIWSSAMEHNIDGVLTHVMRDNKSKLLFTWDQNQCTETDFMCLDKKHKPVFLKELDHIWKKKYNFYPWSNGKYSASNTLLISDPLNALLNPPNTGIFPEDFNPKNKQDDFLGSNGEFRVFLDGLAEANDVPSYVKDHPIGKPAITPSHADWDYYSKIIHAHGKNK